MHTIANAQNVNNAGITQNMGQLASNEGTVNEDVKFYARAGITESYFEDNLVRYVFHRRDDSLQIDSILWAEMQFASSNPNVDVQGKNQLYVANYLLGNLPEGGIQDVPVYDQVIYRNLYEGIDMIVTQQDFPIYDFSVAPNIDPTNIKMDWTGITSIYLENGDLYIQTLGGKIFYKKPTATQNVSGQVVTVDIFYKLDANRVSLSIGTYNPDIALDISISTTPPMNSDCNCPNAWSTRIEKSVVTNKVIATQGNYYNSSSYTTGQMISAFPSFPIGNTGQWVSYGGGNTDAFVMKFAPNKSIVWATYIGGNNDDAGTNIALNSTGDVYCIGVTKSTNLLTMQGTMPTADYRGTGTNGAANRDGFIVRMSPNGQCLPTSYPNTFFTYFGCNGKNHLQALAIDVNNNVYIGGGFENASYNPSFQKTLSGAYNNGAWGEGSFISKILPNNDIVWRSAIGNGFFSANSGHTAMMVDMTTDAAGNVYCIGTTVFPGPTTPITGPITTFTNANQFPIVRPNATATTYNKVTPAGNSGSANNDDYYILKFDVQNRLAWSTFFGSGGEEFALFSFGTAAIIAYETRACAIELDETGNIYIAGTIGNSNNYSSTINIPFVNNGVGYYDNTYNGGYTDGFFAKFSNNLVLQHSTYIGSDRNDLIQGMSIGSYPSKSVMIAGTINKSSPSTVSPVGFPLINGYTGMIGTFNPNTYYYNPLYGAGISSGNSGFIGQLGFNGNLKHLTYFSQGSNLISDISSNGYGDVLTSGYGYYANTGGNPGGIPLWNPGVPGYFHNTGSLTNGGTISQLTYSYLARYANPNPSNILTEEGSAYPNPTSGIVIIPASIENPISEIEVLDILGHSILTQIVTEAGKNIELNLINHAKGTYLLRIKQINSSKVIKLIVQ